ncbi:hypothetical protein [Brevibacillus laterosporus]|uniref:hypothetical protein n=1 Tax=Brevibacillus laterosporus TaxID=1465 RepID=UPI00265CD349|nr:hypothetical protein [Brevibacillus laterosporus]
MRLLLQGRSCGCRTLSSKDEDKVQGNYQQANHEECRSSMQKITSKPPFVGKNYASIIGGETIHTYFGTITANRNQTIWAPFSRSNQLFVKQNPQ